MARLHAGQRLRAVLLRGGLAAGLIVVLFVGVLAVGGANVFSRFLGTVNAADPTTGRSHFWSVTLDVIKAHPLIGSGLGSFSVIYTRYDSRNGLFRLEQAHNDYLQILSDAGIVGGLLGLSFLVILFRKRFCPPQHQRQVPQRRGDRRTRRLFCRAGSQRFRFHFAYHVECIVVSDPGRHGDFGWAG